MIAESLERIADTVLSFNETDLNKLMQHFKSRMEHSDPNPSWERAVIAYFLINGVRVKNALKQGKLQRQIYHTEKYPPLRLVKP